MIRFSQKLLHFGLLTILVIILTNSCYRESEPSIDDAGSLELSSEEISGESYSYKIFKNNDAKKTLGYGLIIYLNGREFIRKTHDGNDGYSDILRSEESAVQVAEKTILELKNTSIHKASKTILQDNIAPSD